MRRFKLPVAVIVGLCLMQANSPGDDNSKPSPARAAYQKQIRTAIGSIWYNYAVKGGEDVPAGSVKMSFRVNPDGSVTRIRVLSSTSSESFKDACVRAVKDSKLPPIPKELLQELKENWLEV